MPNFNPFDMDFEGDVAGIDFLGCVYLMRRMLRSDADEQGEKEWNPSHTSREWDNDDET